MTVATPTLHTDEQPTMATVEVARFGPGKPPEPRGGSGDLAAHLLSPTDAWAGDDLWAEEAAHRARNLAQLAASLHHYYQRRGGNELDAIDRASRALMALYAVIGQPASRHAEPLNCDTSIDMLAANLVALFGPLVGVVHTRVDTQPLSLAGDQARALLLIASEFIINALRHGLKPGGGLLEIGLQRTGDRWTLCVCDDGAGLDPAVPSGTGSRLVRRLADLLDGRVQLVSPTVGGTRAELSFPVRPSGETA